MKKECDKNNDTGIRIPGMSSKHIEYGIEIEKQDKVRTEKSQIKDITTDHTRIDYIVKSLMKNGVTPIHLHDVIEDML